MKRITKKRVDEIKEIVNSLSENDMMLPLEFLSLSDYALPNKNISNVITIDISGVERFQEDIRCIYGSWFKFFETLAEHECTLKYFLEDLEADMEQEANNNDHRLHYFITR